MPPKSHPGLAEPPPDPFRERQRSALHESMQLLGGRFHFESDSPRLLRIVRLAYAKLPSHALSARAPRFLVRLVLTGAQQHARSAIRPKREPPLVRPLSGGGILCGAMGSSNFAALTPQQRTALVVVSQDMLRFPYHIRYELLEFAVYVLAARVQGLVPVHAACVGRNGEGVLLLGPSGSGKSTVALHCLLQGLDFLAEDSVLVSPQSMLATGVANFLHIRPDSLRFLADASGATTIRRSPLIRRRSGVEKFEIDLRRRRYRLAPAPLRIVAVAFISPRSAAGRTLLTPLRKALVTRQLEAGQRYAANQPGWSAFRSAVSRLPGFELRRGRHPLEAVEALEELLANLSPKGLAGRSSRRA
jgi:energy-coupling factor transporter ATP-binding protein EcfA2